MKYEQVTLNTGHVSHHDTTVELAPAKVAAFAELVRARSGVVPGSGGRITYRFSDDRLVAGCTLSTFATYRGEQALVWTVVGYLDEQAAVFAREEVSRDAAVLGVPEEPPDGLNPPGFVLVLHQTASVARPEDIFALADFARTMFAVWALNREAGHGAAG